MTGSSVVSSALRNTSKGKLVYKRDLESLEDEANQSTNLFFNGIAKTLEQISLREKFIKGENEVDYQNNLTETSFLDKTSLSLFREPEPFKRTSESKENNSFYSNQNINYSGEIAQLNLYETQFKIKTEHKITNLVSNLSNHFNEINEESNIKLSEIRQNFFLLKLKFLERYNHEWDDLLNQVANKTSSYDIDQSVKTKLEKVENERIQIQNEIFKRRIKKLKENFSEIKAIDDEFNCELKHKNVQEDEIESFKQMKVLKQKFELLLQRSTPENLNEIVLQEAKQQLFDPILKLVENARNELQQCLAKKPEIQKEKPITEEGATVQITNKKTSESTGEHNGFVSIDDLKFYIKMRKFKISVEESIKQFSNDNKFKEYREKLSLFIRTTVNTLSSNSQEHILDKIERYSRLFSGEIVEFRDKPLSINDHKDAFNFCIYHTANSFLVTGMKQVLASTKSAYVFAQVIVTLCIRFKEFSKIILAFFFEMCPYSVPFYPIRDSNDDDETIYKISCGYSLSKDGKIEDEATFLNKMRALMKLYAAIMRINSVNFSLNLRAGWKWLASILKLEPSNLVSPAVIHAFLSITDSKLKSIYGKQFIKLIRFIKSVYIPKISKLKLKNLQAKVQLETYIDELLKTF